MTCRLFSYLLPFLIVLLTACDDAQEKKKYTPRQMVPRTVLVYIVGDNSPSNDLSDLLKGNFDDLKIGMREVNVEDCNLIVYSEMITDVPRLIRLVNKDGKVKADTLFSYPERNPLKKTVMAEVITETVRLFPAESYGFVFLSHSDAWVPAVRNASRSVGDYRGTQMNISDLHDVLKSSFPGPLKFILFDSCFMQAVEVSYELRDCAEYIIGSPTEIPGPGAPYASLTPYLFEEQEVAEKIANAYFEYYNKNYGKYNVDWKFGVSVSVVKTDALEKLAAITRRILPTYIQNQSYIETDDIMRYDRRYYCYYYDFVSLIKSLTTDNPALYQEWYEAFLKAIPYWQTTGNNYSASVGSFSMEGANGLSIYIPRGEFSLTLNRFYRTYQWYQDAGWIDTGW